jgi:small basic protein
LILIPILALIVGVLIGIQFKEETPLGPYMGVAVIAGIDSICGGLRSAIEGKFRADVFITGFFSNIVISVALLLLGERIGVSLILVVAVVLGGRIFNNLSMMRRMGLTYLADRSARRKREETAGQATP